MINFDLKVGFTCNNNCVHCVIADKKKIFEQVDLTTEEIENIILNKVPKDATVNITGGEATIRKDFEHLINFIYEKGFRITLQTNGTGLADEELVKRIGPKIDHVLLAIHSFNEDIHNKVVNDLTGSMYKKTMKAFENLIKFNVKFATQTVLSSYNIDTLFDTYDNIQKLSPGIMMHMTYPHLMGNAWANREIVAPKYSSIRKQLAKCFKYYARYIYTEAIPFCYIYPYNKYIAYNYDLNCFERGRSLGIDPSLPTKNNKYVKDGVMQDYDVANYNDRLKGSKCKECIFNDSCPGVWKEYIELYKNELDLFPILSFPGAIPLRSNKEECYNECLFCSGGKANGLDSSLDEFKKRADFFFKEGRSQLEITGEPCQYENLIEAIQYLSNNKKVRYIQISTHGRTFADKDLVDKIAEAGATHVRIPLYGSTKEIHEKTAKPKYGGSSFDDTIAGIKNCVDKKLIVCGQTIPNRHNKDDLINIYELYKSLTNNDPNLIKEFVVHFAGISVVDYSWTKDWYLPIKDYGPHVGKFLDYSLEDYNVNNANILTIGIPYCVIGHYDERLRNKVPKPDIGIANVTENMASAESIKIPHYQIREHFEECNHCDLRDICDGLPKNDLVMFGSYGLKAVKE